LINQIIDLSFVGGCGYQGEKATRFLGQMYLNLSKRGLRSRRLLTAVKAEDQQSDKNR
jgi:hypothetical protein